MLQLPVQADPGSSVTDVDDEAESTRLQALRSLDVLDTAAEPLFDELTALAAQLCGTSMALISLVDSDRQWFKSRLGVELCQTSREDVLLRARVGQLRSCSSYGDTHADPRFARNELVTRGAPSCGSTPGRRW